MAFSNEFVYGFHGCSRDVAEMLLSGKDVSLNSSENDYDWLGSGIYFWEEAPHRALEWAQKKFGKDRAYPLAKQPRERRLRWCGSRCEDSSWALSQPDGC